MASPIDNSRGSSALAKGLGLLRAIALDDGSTPASRHGARLGLSRATLNRHLADLQHHGLIMRVDRGRYQAGMAFVGMTSGLTLYGQLAKAARGPLRRLTKRVGLTSHLGVLDGDMVTYLVKSPAPKSAVNFTQENGQLEAYCSGIGKVLLANLPTHDQAAYLAGGPFVPLTARTLTGEAALKAALAMASRDDFAVDDGEIAEGLRCLAVPVRDQDGAVIAAISASMMQADDFLDDNRLLRELRLAASEITGGGSAAVTD